MNAVGPRPRARWAVPWVVFLLVACGVTQPPAGVLSGRVLRGMGLDGRISGLPFPDVRVVLEDSGARRSVTTGPGGRFAFPLPAGPFSLHAIPPDLDLAGALSFVGLDVRRTGTDLTVTLPLLTSVGGSERDTGNRPQVALRGVLLRPDGAPQPGFIPQGLFPGLPGSRGAVVWGFYGIPAPGGGWVYSTAARSDGSFEISGLLGGQALARTHFLFAGNYDGRAGSMGYFTLYAFREAVTVLAGSPADLGPTVLRPVESHFSVAYAPESLAVARAYFEPGAATYTFVAVEPGVLGDPIEVAEVSSGPGSPGPEPFASVPVPAIAGAGRPYAVTSFLIRAGCGPCARAGTLVLGSAAPSAVIRYLPPPVALTAQGSTFRWRPPEGVTVQFVYAQDARTLLTTWGAYLPPGGSEATVPFRLPRGAYLVRVYAEDFLRPEDLVGGEPATSLPATLPFNRSLALLRSGRLRVQTAGVRVVRASLSEVVRVSL